MYTFVKVTVSFFIFLTSLTYSQLSGSYNVGAGQTYTTLTGSSGFFDAVNTQGLSGNVTVNITSDISEPGTVSLNQWSGSNTITIQPSTASLKTLTGNVNSPLFNFNGADRVTIDGRVSGSGRYLSFVNQSTSGSTFRFIGGATNNTITYCIVEGTNTTIAGGTIELSTSSGSIGNDDNTISNSLLRDVTSGGTPVNMIYSNGSTSPSSTQNKNITISNNEIYNFYRNGQNSSAVYLAGGSRNFTITGNSFYQTATRTNTLSSGWNVININTSAATNITITNNFFGGSAANCGGSAWTVNGNVSNYLYFIRFSTAGTSSASNVHGNVMRNVSFTSTPSASAASYFAGIIIESGLVNVGTTSGNTIGNTTTNGNITLTFNGTTDNIINRGIDHRGSGSIENNIIGSISIGGTNNRTVRLECILYSSTPSADVSISNNTVGSLTTSNSIQQISGSFTCQLTGIHSAINTRTVTMDNNTVANLRVISTNTSSRVRGIFQARSTSAPIVVTDNTISELYCAGSSTDRFPDNCMLIGLFTGSNSVTQTVTGNTISGLYGTGNSNSYVQGFSFYNNVAKGNFENNKIYNLNHSSTSGSPRVWAVNAFWGSWSFYNNQISVTNGEASDNITPEISGQNSKYSNNSAISLNTDGINVAQDLVKEEEVPNLNQSEKPKIFIDGDAFTNAAELKGIHDEAEFPCVYYYNSVYVGGTAASGSADSWAYDRPLSAWPTPAILRNNIFFNARTGGSGSHYAFGNEVGVTNWTNTSSNYNVFVSSNLNTIGTWGAADQTIQQWRTSSGGDKHTWSTVSTSFSATNLFNDIANCDLTIKTGNFEAWLVSGKGIGIAAVSTDYQGNARPTAVSGGCSDIGADEFSSTPPNNPLATVDNPPGSGITSNYSLWGRVLLTIEWGTGGSSYPSSMNVRYYSGVNPGGVLGGGYSNSYWDVTPNGTLSGAYYDITINFGDNETYSILTPGSNTRLAKYDGTWEVFSTSGTGNWETELNWANYWAKTRGMISFSDYALTDGSNPLPVEMCSFSAAIMNRDAHLNWVTCWEINNMGFDVERRTFNSLTSSYGNWLKVGFIEGHGTTNEQQSYKYKDLKLVTGKYQYRLKQIDYNSNFEYYNLTNPDEIIIGKPNVADLFQNYPNPSNPVSKVDFQIPFNGKVSIKVYDVSGKEVAVLTDKQYEAGFYTVEFNGSNLASGVYFYRLIAESTDGNRFTKTIKLVLIK
ncbi:MAG: T9SS type A sorting domain-containing protein [Chlorobi bacterium]|nr:T9SS type A sorting domain-containing protein [Chlorobiota bacterium]MCI0717330.1 T9SS type A sorting domain-containing protein [Chlorobiota bacterium]